jgi:peptidyl-prolyl cis-trans isomerase B (cyclophilin B)
VNAVLRSSLAAIAAVLAIAASGCSSNSSSSQTSGASQPGGSQPAAAGATTTCAYAPSGGSASLPPSKTDPNIAYTATMHTSQGDIPITLLDSKAPCTVNSFVHLAESGFWAGTQCHRLSADSGLYMLQCGDPTAKAGATLSCDGSVGSGGPGYSFNDENLSGATYNAGTVAMANAGPNTNGSQFFLVFQDSQLSPAYTPFGTISAAGLAVLRKVAQGGTSCTFAGAGGGVPKDKVVINSVTIAKG